MLEPRRRPDLREKTLAAECGAEVGVEDLDGDVAVVALVVREEDRRHAAGAELALDAVATGERLAESSEDVVRHVAGIRGDLAEPGERKRSGGADRW
jgi:hypothetical protein